MQQYNRDCVFSRGLDGRQISPKQTYHGDGRGGGVMALSCVGVNAGPTSARCESFSQRRTDELPVLSLLLSDRSSEINAGFFGQKRTFLNQASHSETLSEEHRAFLSVIQHYLTLSAAFGYKIVSHSPTITNCAL